MGISYRDAGVNIEAGKEFVNKIKAEVESTFTPGVLGGLGGFGGLFLPDLSAYQEPVLVAGTDGVGTKLKIAFALNYHQSIGIDLVAMCVNDILVQGAKPLFFLDYLATGQLAIKEMSDIIKGIARGCQEAACALIGGETAELPGFYSSGEYDLAGFAVGIVDKNKIISGRGIKVGDQIIGLSSNGLHSNGFSLARKVLLEWAQYDLSQKLEWSKLTLGEELLKPTRIYVKPVLKLMKEYEIRGMAHITGGGFLENIPRILPEGVKAVIKRGSWPEQPIFALIQEIGEIAPEEMFRTFNMGIGLVLVVDKALAGEVLIRAGELGEKAYLLGEIVAGAKGVEIS